MNEILGEIYCLFESLFGENFGEYLWGWNCDAGNYSNPSKFNQIGLICVSVSLIAVVLFYYVFNPVRRQRMWWFVILGVSACVNGFIGYYITVSDYLNAKIGDCLCYEKDGNGNIVSTLITEWECVYFGITNMIISAIFFFIFSMMLKWGSSGNRNYPF